MQVVKVYGAERTGTNYLSKLLALNFNIVEIGNTLGWKHGPILNAKKCLESKEPIGYEGKTRVKKRLNHKKVMKRTGSLKHIKRAVENSSVIRIAIIKNPYSWATSIQRWRKHGSSAIDLLKEVKWFNKIYKDWAANADIIITYEEILQDYKKAMRKIAAELGLKRTKNPYQNVTKPVGYTAKHKNFDMFKKKYLNKEYKSKLTGKMKTIVTNNIDWDLVGRFGYKRDKI